MFKNKNWFFGFFLRVLVISGFSVFNLHAFISKKVEIEKFDSVWQGLHKKNIDDIILPKINIQNQDGVTPLALAIKDKEIALVNKLLLLKADILIPDNNGATPLDLAVLSGDQILVQKLLKSSCVSGVCGSKFDDISFGIVDLKFDGEKIKICEFGEGTRSMFNGIDTFFWQGFIWQSFWKFLSIFKLPTWYVASSFSENTYTENAFKSFELLGGRFVNSLSVLGRDTVFVNSFSSTGSCMDNFFANQKALVVLRDNSYRDVWVRFFKIKYPYVLFLDDAIGPFVNSKLLTNKLFQNEKLKQYRPKCKICKKIYTKKLAKSIIDELQCDRFVIKPVNSSKGHGVIIVEKKDLGKILHAILKDPNQLPDLSDPTYNYWLHDKNKVFIVEEYAYSKEIISNHFRYDATMRVIFVLMCDHGRIFLNFLSSYWKLPAKSVRSHGSLTETHKSHINPQKESSLRVGFDDYEKVKEILRMVLPEVYVEMLRDRENYCKSISI